MAPETSSFKKNTATEKLASQILLYKELYYLGRPAISDEAFDALENKLRSLDPNHPALSFVGYQLKETAGKVPHRPPMLSLSKTYETSELAAFASGRDLVISDKVDGMALSLEYDFEGRLLRASTRGNGQWGEDVTPHVMHILNIPKHIAQPENNGTVRFEVRGEVYFPIAEFSLFEDRFDSYRNAVPGTFGRKEVDEAVDVLNVLRFRAYDLIGFLRHEKETDESLMEAAQLLPLVGATYLEKLKWLESAGFDTGLPEKTTRLLLGNDGGESLPEQVTSAFKRERDHQIDGIVLRLNDEQLFEAIGSTSHHPRGSLAFKMEGESAVTEILAIETSLGRSGKVTFRAQVRPVQLSGAMISYATLHNAEFIRSGGYAPGALVRITRSGEVIPSIIGLEKEPPESYQFPEACPCGFPLTISGPDLFCSQNISCAPKDQESFLYFAQTLEIQGLSEKTVAKLREAGLIATPADFFKLKVEDVLALEGFAKKSAENLVSSIQARKKIPLALFLASLGLKRGGVVKCREVASRFSSLQKVLQTTPDELSSERGWAGKSASDFIDSLHSRKNWIDSLLEVVEVEEDDSQQKKSLMIDHPLSGKNLCITGALSQPREVYVKKLENIGAKVGGSVTSKTHFLVCNEVSGSSKYAQATKLGIPIISEDELNSMLSSGK